MRPPQKVRPFSFLNYIFTGTIVVPSDQDSQHKKSFLSPQMHAPVFFAVCLFFEIGGADSDTDGSSPEPGCHSLRNLVSKYFPPRLHKNFPALRESSWWNVSADNATDAQCAAFNALRATWDSKDTSQGAFVFTGMTHAAVVAALPLLGANGVLAAADGNKNLIHPLGQFVAARALADDRDRAVAGHTRLHQLLDLAATDVTQFNALAHGIMWQLVAEFAHDGANAAKTRHAGVSTPPPSLPLPRTSAAEVAGSLDDDDQRAAKKVWRGVHAACDRYNMVNNAMMVLCAHGVGHGIFSHFGGQSSHMPRDRFATGTALARPLAMCNAASDDALAANCAGGVLHSEADAMHRPAVFSHTDPGLKNNALVPCGGGWPPAAFSAEAGVSSEAALALRNGPRVPELPLRLRAICMLHNFHLVMPGIAGDPTQLFLALINSTTVPEWPCEGTSGATHVACVCAVAKIGFTHPVQGAVGSRLQLDTYCAPRLDDDTHELTATIPSDNDAVRSTGSVLPASWAACVQCGASFRYRDATSWRSPLVADESHVSEWCASQIDAESRLEELGKRAFLALCTAAALAVTPGHAIDFFGRAQWLKPG